MFRNFFHYLAHPIRAIFDFDFEDEFQKVQSDSALHARIAKLNRELGSVDPSDVYDYNTLDKSVIERNILTFVKGIPNLELPPLTPSEARSYLRFIALQSKTHRKVTAQVGKWLFV